MSLALLLGTTALLFVHAYLHRLREALPGRVTLTVVSDEETGGRWGSDWLVKNCAGEVMGDCMLNTEPSGVHTVRFGEKSIFWLRFRIAVPGGHSAYPHTSPSANKIAASLIKDLEAIEGLAPEEPEVVRRTLDRPDVQTAIDRSLGAGAAGLMCAMTVGQRGRRVLLIEHNSALGRKILISGGGRCNFTNVNAGPGNYFSQNPDFCRSALAGYPPERFIELVERHGIAYHEKKLAQLFCDGSAQQVLACFLVEIGGGGFFDQLLVAPLQ